MRRFHDIVEFPPGSMFSIQEDRLPMLDVKDSVDVDVPVHAALWWTAATMQVELSILHYCWLQIYHKNDAFTG